MLLEKYQPVSTKEIIGNPSQLAEIRKFLAGWKKGRALLVHGPTGSGKSTAIKLVAQESGYDLVEACSNEKRTISDYYNASQQHGIFSRKRIMLFEDLETMPMRGFADLISRSEHPVICVIGDAYQLPPDSRKLFRIVKFEKVNDTDLLKFLENICKKECIAAERRRLEQLVKTSNGDIRGLLIDLEMLKRAASIGYRDNEDNIFSTLKIIFKTMSLDNSKIAVDNCEKEPEELMRWLEENIAEEYTDIDTIAMAFDYLSKADIFSSRIIRRQSWSLQKYLSMAAYGTALAKSRPSARFISYRYPVFARKNAVLEKISKNLHISKRRAAVYIPVLRMLAKKNSDILEELGIDEKEAAILNSN